MNFETQSNVYLSNFHHFLIQKSFLIQEFRKTFIKISVEKSKNLLIKLTNQFKFHIIFHED
jgi:hypothetical protein